MSLESIDRGTILLSLLCVLHAAGCTCAHTHRSPDAELDGEIEADGGLHARDATTDAGMDAGMDGALACSELATVHADLTHSARPSAWFDARELPDIGVIVGRAAASPAEEPVLFVYDLASGEGIAFEDASVWSDGRLLVDAPTNRVAYVSGGALFSFDPRTNVRVRLSGIEEVVGIADLSADGSRVLYYAYDGAPSIWEGSDLFIASMDGSGAAQLSGSRQAGSAHIVGARIVYVDGGRGRRGVYSVRLDGSGRLRLDRPAAGGEAAWVLVAPDGRVVYAAEESVPDVLELHAIEADGTDRAALSGPLTEEGLSALTTLGPLTSLAPDGARALYRVGAELRTVGLDGSEPRTISTGEATSTHDLPHFTLDGASVLFVSSDDTMLRIAPAMGGPGTTLATVAHVHEARVVGNRAVYVADGDTPELRSVAFDGSESALLHTPTVPGEAFDPATRRFEVTPDAGWVIFPASTAPTASALYRVRPDGTGQERLSDAPTPGYSAAVRHMTADHLLYVERRSGESTLLRFDLATGERTNITEGFTEHVVEDVVGFLESDDGRSLAHWNDGVTGEVVALHLMDRATGRDCLVEIHDEEDLVMDHARFHPRDGHLYYRARTPEGIELRRADPSTCASTLVEAQSPTTHLVFAPDGSLVHVRVVGDVVQLVITAADGSGARVLSDPTEDGGLRLSRGHAATLTLDGTRAIYFGADAVFSVQLDGSERARLSDAPPEWATHDFPCVPAIDTPGGVVLLGGAGNPDEAFGAVMRAPRDGSAAAVRLGDPSWMFVNDSLTCSLAVTPSGDRVVFPVFIGDRRVHAHARIDGTGYGLAYDGILYDVGFLESRVVASATVPSVSFDLRALSLDGAPDSILFHGRTQHWVVPERDEVVVHGLDDRSMLLVVDASGAVLRRFDDPATELVRVGADGHGNVAFVARDEGGFGEVHGAVAGTSSSRLARGCSRDWDVRDVRLSHDGTRAYVQGDLRTRGIMELYELRL